MKNSYEDLEEITKEGYVFGKCVRVNETAEYKLISALGRNNYDEFIDIIMKLAVASQVVIPLGITDIKDPLFHSRALAFMMGVHNGSLTTY